jgi:hypothetical protein
MTPTARRCRIAAQASPIRTDRWPRRRPPPQAQADPPGCSRCGSGSGTAGWTASGTVPSPDDRSQAKAACQSSSQDARQAYGTAHARHDPEDMRNDLGCKR